MMGPYQYYESSMIDGTSGDLNIHDCMWSGECYSCQPARLTMSSAPIALAKAPSDNEDLLSIKSELIELVELASELEEEDTTTSTTTEPYKSVKQEPDTEPEPEPNILKKNKEKNRKKRSKPREKVTDIAEVEKQSADTKKLRHREVEKNRHRQLQAMVKTLSEKIPGKLDKETQVQTMKRAARYCVYLRDVLTTLKNEQPASLRQKLEKIYIRSCDNVELIMSQHLSNR